MWIDRQDLLYTIRSARREPLLSIIAVAALSLGKCQHLGSIEPTISTHDSGVSHGFSST